MNNEMKRRVFLSGIIGTLIGVPVAVRLIGGRKSGSVETHRFTSSLKKYQSLLDVQVTELSDVSSAALPLAPQIAGQHRYVIFAPSYFPNELSRAVGSEPDAFLVREGELFVDQVANGQIVLTGGDSVSSVISPIGTDDREPSQVTILCKNNQLRFAAKRGVRSELPADLQLPHLLSLLNPPKDSLRAGRKWQSRLGRIRPFTGYLTNYEVLGFSDVSGHNAVKIGFSGQTQNLVGMPGLNTTKPDKGSSMVSRHHGNAWFDLETGLLIRQETELESTVNGVLALAKPSKKTNDISQQPEVPSMTVKSRFYVQLFSV